MESAAMVVAAPTEAMERTASQAALASRHLEANT
jgi:hypothetical protein